MKRRYLNQGSSGPSYSSVTFGSASSAGIKQEITVTIRAANGLDTVPNVVLDAEQVADLRDYLLKICPCASSDRSKKFVDE